MSDFLTQAPIPEENPLKKYFRQAKVYVTLPSQGKFYKPGALRYPQNGELPVMAMTAKDELTMKTPDALLNGQATVDVIKSCVPDIVDPWEMPSIDLDAVLIAIRIATYGETLEITTKVPGVGEERDFTVDLRQILNSLVSTSYESVCYHGDMEIHLRPMTYREFTDSSLKTFEEQRIFKLVNDKSVPDEEKLARFSDSFKKLTDLTMTVISNSIACIKVGDHEVDNREHIAEFLANADKDFYNTVHEHLEAQKEKFQIKPMTVKSSDEDIENGAPESYEIPITFDQSNFFA